MFPEHEQYFPWTMTPSPSAAANRSPASPHHTRWQFGPASCSSPSLPATVAHFGRSPNMRAQRVKPKSHRDDSKIAKGKRSAALGSAGKISSSPFSKSVFAPKGLGAKTDLEKGVTGGLGVLPRAAASAALPWAIIMLPLRGVGGANPRGAGKDGAAFLFPAGGARTALPEQRRWTACHL